MVLTIYPTPKLQDEQICDINYEFGNILYEAIEIYVFRNRVCYDFIFDTDVINVTLLSLLIMRYFNEWAVKLKLLVMGNKEEILLM